MINKNDYMLIKNCVYMHECIILSYDELKSADTIG